MKSKLREGAILFGTAVSIAHQDVAEVLGRIGYDFVVFDMEHSPLEVGNIQSLLQVIDPKVTVPIVRVAWNDIVLIKRALDIGAYGIIVPWVNSREDAIKAVQAVRYPPRGLRGFGPRRASLGDPDYVKTANDEIFLGVMIETQSAIDRVDEILSVEGIDAAFIGPYDLSMSLGVFTQWNNPKFTGSLKKILDSAVRNGVMPGVLATTEWQKRIQEGFKAVVLSLDLFLLQEYATKALEEGRDFVEKMKQSGHD